MDEELNTVPVPEPEVQDDGVANETPEKEEAGCLGIGASVLFPLIGIIIYFAQRKEVKNPGAYLWGALAGIIIGIILRAASGALEN